MSLSSKLTGRHLSGFPATTRTNFFAAVDKWQSDLLLEELRKEQRGRSGGELSTSVNIFDLPSPVVQLLSNEPQILKVPEIERLVDESIRRSTRSVPQATSLGLTSLIAHLLSSTDSLRREWAMNQLVGCAQRPISLEEWFDNGIGEDVQHLWTANLDHAEPRWSALEQLLRSRCLSLEVIQIGLLEGKSSSATDRTTRPRSVMAALGQVLGSEVPCQSLDDVSALSTDNT